MLAPVGLRSVSGRACRSSVGPRGLPVCEEIERLLSEEDISWSAEKNRIHCMNHVINLAVQDFLKSIKAIKTNTDGSVYVEEDLEFDGHGQCRRDLRWHCIRSEQLQR